MIIAEMKNVKKFYGDRLILDIPNFKLESGERMGIVGTNGSGKTTFLNILIGTVTVDEGEIKLIKEYSLINQLGSGEANEASRENISKFGVKDVHNLNRSGGEETRIKIAAAFSNNSRLIIADEPTSNLDREGIELLQRELKSYKGSILMVSHDREILNEICNKILEVDNGRIRIYKGNYSTYKRIKEEERAKMAAEYENYITEKNRLERAVIEVKEKSKSINRTPKRMGNSEARLHKMGGQKGKKKLDNTVKNIQARIDKLEVKERPARNIQVKIDIQEEGTLNSKVVFRSDDLNKAFGPKVVFDKAVFSIIGESKTAIIGANGSGKTTLLKMLIEEEGSIWRSKAAKVGYFNQDITCLADDKTLLMNVLESSIISDTQVRAILARLLFKREDLNKKAGVLSGGERVKGAIAKIMVSDFNVLILDEPTNYLDVYSMEALEESLKDYNGTVIFVSHDRSFVNEVADHILLIENSKIHSYQGKLREFISKRESIKEVNNIQEEKILLENRKAEVISRLSFTNDKAEKEKLDKEFNEILSEIRELSQS